MEPQLQVFRYKSFNEELDDSKKNGGCDNEEHDHCDAFTLLEDNIEYTQLYSIFYNVSQGEKITAEERDFLEKNGIILLREKSVSDFEKVSKNQPRINLKRADMEKVKANYQYSIFLIPEKVQNDLKDYEDMRKFVHSDDNGETLDHAIDSLSEEQIKRFLCFSILELENNKGIRIPNKDLTKDINGLMKQLENGFRSLGPSMNMLYFRFIQDAINRKIKQRVDQK